jgi:hypothetical protein
MRIRKQGNYIVITDDNDKELFNVHSSRTDFVKNESNEIDIFDNGIPNFKTSALRVLESELKDEVGGELEVSPISWLRDNTGFNTASGGSGALQIVTGDGTTTIDLGSFGLVNFQFGAYDEVFTFIPPSKAGIFVLKLTQDSVGSRTATFPANVKFTEGIQPTLSTTPTTGTDIITFYFDGANFLAVEALNFI